MRLGALRVAVGLALGGATVVGVTIGGGLSRAAAATGANFISTGHDMDLHCAGGDTAECAYFKIVVDKVRNGSTLPILALDEGTELTDALSATSETPVTAVDPSNAAVFNATAFISSTGAPLFSAIITASDGTCGGCDNSTTGEANINARANDFKAFFNAGGGILALAGAENRATYYNFVPLSSITAAAVSEPFTVTTTGAALGITAAMANCCATHNSFEIPSAPLVVLETDNSGLAETIAAFNATIGGGGFTSVTATKVPDQAVTTPGAPNGYTVTFSNSGTSAATLTSVVDTLPAGFAYVAGSSTGGITANPAIVGSQLTWTGPFTVPASGNFQFHFNVTVSATTGTFTNSVSGFDGSTALATATGAVDVATVVSIPAFPAEGFPVAAALGGGILALWWRRHRSTTA
jgi:uncharacterized repeat protein (TIGR01451 family)